jgi:thioredoxin reductase (NADPH)
MHNVAIVGAGPAGIAASIFLKRAGFDVQLFEKNQVGGLLLNANFVENYPGFPNGVKGSELCKLFKIQLENWSINPIFEDVVDITRGKNKFILKTTKSIKEFRAVLIATGSKPKKLGIPGEKKFFKKHIFYEVKDILPIIKSGDNCIIIGGGDTAFDYALNLSENNASVDLYFRSKSPKCLPLLEKRVKKITNIKLHPFSIPIKVDNINNKIVIQFQIKENKNIIHLNNKLNDSNHTNIVTTTSDYILIACGRLPNDDIISKDFMEENISGLYIAGDLRKGKYRQVGIAIGDGIYKAMCIEEYLKGIVL